MIASVSVPWGKDEREPKKGSENWKKETIELTKIRKKNYALPFA